MVRYLAGNPWSAVTDPATISRVVDVQIERALSADLSSQVRAELDARFGGDDLGGLTPSGDEVRQWGAAVQRFY